MGETGGSTVLFRAALAAALACAWPGPPALGGEVRSSWTGYAVIVGMADYPGTEDDFPGNMDGPDMYDALLRDGDHWLPANVKLLCDSQATRTDVMNALDSMGASAGPDDVCVFFFSGHGSQGYDFSPYDEDDGLDESLYVYGSLISDDELASTFGTYSCNHICVIVDACYAGGMTKSDGEPWTDGFAADLLAGRASARGAGGTPRDMDRSGIVALMSSAEHESSYWRPDLPSNAIFPRYVIEALGQAVTDLDGNGFASAEEVFAYAAPPTEKWGFDQHPKLYDSHGGELDLITTGDGKLKGPAGPGDFPFGGGYVYWGYGYLSGCVPAEGGPAASAAAVIPALVLLALALVLGRKRPAAALASAFLVAATLAGGCLGTAARPPADCVLEPQALISERPALGWPEGADVMAGAERSGGAGAEDTTRLAVRGGLVVPVAPENASYSATLQLGLYLRGPLRGSRFELGADVFKLDGVEVAVQAQIFSLRLDFFPAREFALSGRELYVHAGPRLLLDLARPTWGPVWEVVAGAGLGAGVRSPDRGWDVRVSLDALLGSSNLKGFITVTAGRRF